MAEAKGNAPFLLLHRPVFKTDAANLYLPNLHPRRMVTGSPASLIFTCPIIADAVASLGVSLISNEGVQVDISMNVGKWWAQQDSHL